MPLNLTVEYGLTPTDLHASIRWLVMLLWPHPLQSVDGSPWKATIGRVRVWPLFWIWIVASLAMGRSPRCGEPGFVAVGPSPGESVMSRPAVVESSRAGRAWGCCARSM